MNLRDAARDQPCSMCSRHDDTIVLHHLRVGNPGMGRKPPDHHGVYLCAACHDWVHGEGRADYKLMLMAYLRQVDKWLADEVMVLQ